MSASIRFPNYKHCFTRKWRMSNKAKRNRAINGGSTAATIFYARWRP